VSERVFRIAAAALVTAAALIAMLLGREAWFTPLMDCFRYSP
jgi:hypothetical protein